MHSQATSMGGACAWCCAGAQAAPLRYRTCAQHVCYVWGFPLMFLYQYTLSLPAQAHRLQGLEPEFPVLGERRYIRPEVRFSGLGELVARIRTDVGLASAALEAPTHADLRRHEFLA